MTESKKPEPGIITAIAPRLDALVLQFCAWDDAHTNPPAHHYKTLMEAIYAAEKVILGAQAQTLGEAALQVRIANGRLDELINPGYAGHDEETRIKIERAYWSAIKVMRALAHDAEIGNIAAGYYGHVEGRLFPFPECDHVTI